MIHLRQTSVTPGISNLCTATDVHQLVDMALRTRDLLITLVISYHSHVTAAERNADGIGTGTGSPLAHRGFASACAALITQHEASRDLLSIARYFEK